MAGEDPTRDSSPPPKDAELSGPSGANGGRSMTLKRNRRTLALAEELKAALARSLFGAGTPGTSLLEKIPRSSMVQGFGYGTKVSQNVMGAEVAVRVYVRTKLPKRDLAAAERIPEDIDGVLTDVIATGDIRAHFPRPVHCGASISEVNSRAGTLGCLVENAAGERFILSNNHVLANINTAHRGDVILEPAALIGGGANPPIGRLVDFEPLLFSGKNHIDAAIARPIDATSVLPDILSIGRVVPRPLPAVKNMSVIKFGSTTQQTMGIVSDITADVPMRYGTKLAHFTQQIAVTGCSGIFSDGGDSGALVLDAITDRPVGLLFGGGGTTSFCNPIDLVLARFGVSIV
jgi:hypothetical protein